MAREPISWRLTVAAAASPAAKIQQWAMWTPPVTISADSSDLSTQNLPMNEQPSSLSLTIGESPTKPPKQDSFPSDKNARGVFALSPYSLLFLCIFMCQVRNQEQSGMWIHSGCRWCCVVHPCGWRLAVCALSCVMCNTGGVKIKWHGVGSLGLKF